MAKGVATFVGQKTFFKLVNSIQGSLRQKIFLPCARGGFVDKRHVAYCLTPFRRG
jgi:hypothetical protein